MVNNCVPKGVPLLADPPLLLSVPFCTIPEAQPPAVIVTRTARIAISRLMRRRVGTMNHMIAAITVPPTGRCHGMSCLSKEAVFAAVLIVSVLVPLLPSDVGEKAHVICAAAGGVQPNVIVPANPPELVTVAATCADLPCVMFRDVGFRLTVKSLIVTARVLDVALL